ncbi:MAG: molybdopterin molybdotransferase MoeA [Euryarchaeota archaeon]|jgi:molybdopterin molybdotransferase|uniref:Molybdenum cofactor synthesis domain protein n=1 Tax=Methanothrix harundinacea TaxID=301375 RepID=A0A117MCC5_9EURY|nr:MAG: molybdenum cofactor biosynthesis protein [Methanosaeta sp. SDB]KUK96252.1 MAG: Molybdenum cofactor synthesis domain protein [Methanothrix harundinacea]MCP1393289.1 molybdopterin molybdotransferase MoeA [Methanothrix harundinacea]MDD3709783.1 molybdopterin molybdotransferase MoeA [Methanothrix sp.]MDI9399544.1 molybdopterin molybdotransferase MoeA [Euryarchaeota archaeon]
MFKKLASASESLKSLLERCGPVNRGETVHLSAARGRVLSEDVTSPANLPGFNRAAMDGYAVRAANTRGATPLAPIYLKVAEEAGEGRCVPVRTGMPAPPGSDAVLMLEDALLRGQEVEATAEVHPYRNLARVGEDVALSETIFREGHRLRPPDIALLASLGLTNVQVRERPKVAIIPTGGELVPLFSDQRLLPGQAREANGIMCEMYAEIWGGSPRKTPIFEDDAGIIKEAIAENLDADLILISGGTSIGEEDYAPSILAEMGELLVHGVRITPGKPTALGIIDGKPVICLPGYPVAALSALYIFARPLITMMAHRTDLPRIVTAKLEGKIVSRPGYLTFARVSLKDGVATPIMTSGAGILSSVARAEGYVLVPEEVEGREKGEMVEVNLIE